GPQAALSARRSNRLGGRSTVATHLPQGGVTPCRHSRTFHLCEAIADRHAALCRHPPDLQPNNPRSSITTICARFLIDHGRRMVTFTCSSNADQSPGDARTSQLLTDGGKRRACPKEPETRGLLPQTC